MIIDIHTHTFPEKIADAAIQKMSHMAHTLPHTNGTEPELLASMKKNGVDISIVQPVATSPRQVEKVNDASARINERFAGKGILSFGCMHPDYENYRSELERIRSLGMRGIKLHPVYQDVCINDIRMIRIMERAAELGLVVLTHAGADIGFPGVVRCSPQMCRDAVQAIGSFPLILAHMGGWRNWEEVPEFLADTGVYIDTAFSTGCYQKLPEDPGEDSPDMLDEAAFMQLTEVFGTDHVLYGSDSPWSDQGTVLAFIQGLPLTGIQKAQILGGNAAELLGL